MRVDVLRLLRATIALSCGAATGFVPAACASPPPPDARATTSSVRASIEAEIARSLDATRRQDIDAFMSGFAPDFEIVAPGGGGDRVTLADLRTNMLRDWAIIPATRALTMRVDSIAPAARDSAVVYTDQRWDRLMLERDGVTRDTVVTTQKHRELWRRTPDGWRRARVTELGGTVVVNGKPYPRN